MKMQRGSGKQRVQNEKQRAFFLFEKVKRLLISKDEMFVISGDKNWF